MVQFQGLELARLGQPQAVHPGLRTSVSLAGRDVVGHGVRPVVACAAVAMDAATVDGNLEGAVDAGALEFELLHAAPTHFDRRFDGVVLDRGALSQPGRQ